MVPIWFQLYLAGIFSLKAFLFSQDHSKDISGSVVDKFLIILYVFNVFIFCISGSSW